MKKLVTLLMLLLPFCLNAQVDRKEVREGRRKYAKGDFKEAELDFRKAVVKDSLSVPGQYDLASALYRQQNFDEAAKALDCIKEVAPASPHAAACHYNAGDIALAKKDYAAAAKAFREALLLNPGDLDAKENYIYAKKMMQRDQGGSGGDDNQNQNQDQQNQDQNQDNQQEQQQPQQQPQDQNQDRQDQQQQQQQISPRQAQQMLQAIQAKEKDTKDKVDKEKAAAMQSRQKEKNW